MEEEEKIVNKQIYLLILEFKSMAVNFLRINLSKSVMVYPFALWNVYTQILRYNCENKGELKQIPA